LASNSQLAEGLSAQQRQQREHENKCLVSYSFTFAIIAGLCSTGVLCAFGPQILAAMGTNAVMMEPALSYLTWRALAAPAVMIMNVCQGVCLGQQNSVTPLLVFSAVGALNVVLDTWLILGQGMGCAGAAIATAAAQWLGAVYFINRLHKTVCSISKLFLVVQPLRTCMTGQPHDVHRTYHAAVLLVPLSYSMLV
jgi:Na+-driven multidrug efflux pump